MTWWQAVCRLISLTKTRLSLAGSMTAFSIDLPVPQGSSWLGQWLKYMPLSGNNKTLRRVFKTRHFSRWLRSLT